MSTILVLGANGTVGSRVAQHLLDQGHTVRRATHRAPGQPGQVRLDLASGAGLAAAVDGAGSVFLLVPPGYTNQDELLAPVVAAAKAHGVRKLVMMSAMGANADPNAPLRKAELAVERSGLVWNVIRPNWFMQNFATFWLHDILTHGAIRLPTGTAKGSFIDARDIAEVAAKLLVRDAFDNRDFDLTGPAAHDHAEVAALLTRETGRAVRYEDITPEAMRDNLLAAGVPANYADFLVLILGFFKAGYSERTTDAVQTILGRAPGSLARYARDHRQVWATRAAA